MKISLPLAIILGSVHTSSRDVGIGVRGGNRRMLVVHARRSHACGLAGLRRTGRRLLRLRALEHEPREPRGRHRQPDYHDNDGRSCSSHGVPPVRWTDSRPGKSCPEQISRPEARTETAERERTRSGGTRTTRTTAVDLSDSCGRSIDDGVTSQPGTELATGSAWAIPRTGPITWTGEPCSTPRRPDHTTARPHARGRRPGVLGRVRVGSRDRRRRAAHTHGRARGAWP